MQGFRLDKKTRPIYLLSAETHFRPKDTSSLKMKGWRTIYHSNGPQKKAGVAILISNKLNYIPKTIIRYEEELESYLKDLPKKRA